MIDTPWLLPTGSAVTEREQTIKSVHNMLCQHCDQTGQYTTLHPVAVSIRETMSPPLTTPVSTSAAATTVYCSSAHTTAPTTKSSFMFVLTTLSPQDTTQGNSIKGHTPSIVLLILCVVASCLAIVCVCLSC